MTKIRHLLKSSRNKALIKLVKRKLMCGENPYPGITRETLNVLEKLTPRLQDSRSKSLLKKHLTPKVFDDLKRKRTCQYDSNLLDCIQCGLVHRNTPIGVYAADGDCYKVFGRLFDPIIEDLHGFKNTNRHPKPTFGDIDGFGDLDPYGHFIISTRIRALRNLAGYPFAPKMLESDYTKMEQEVVPTLLSLKGEHKGWFHTQDEQLRSTQVIWIENHLFRDPSPEMKAGNICRFLPTGRGFYHNLEKNFSVWLNYEDHLRIVSMQQGAHFGQVYRRLVTAIDEIERNHQFCHDSHLGYLTCDPKNLGTALRASVLMKLVKLPAREELFKEALEKFHLQVLGTYGKNTPVEGGLYDISNKHNLGITEFDAVKSVYDGAAEIMYLEKGIKGCCCSS